MKRVASILLSIVMLFSITAGVDLSAIAAESADGKYEYSIEDDGTARITKYLGTDANVDIPAEIDGYCVTGIGNFSFYKNEQLTSVTIPDTVTWIGGNAFRENEALTSVKIGKNVIAIRQYVFYGCTNLSTIEVPDGLTIIGQGCFEGTAYYNNDANWANDVLYIGNYLIKARDTISGKYTVKDGTTIIADYAFNECSGLTYVTMPDTVTKIGDYSFNKCSGLTGVDLSEGLKEIWDYAFFDCSALSSVTFPDGLEIIYGEAFGYCTSLTSITIPSSVKDIGVRAFYSCQKLANISLPDSDIYLGLNTFYDTAYYNNEASWENDVLYIGKHLVNAKETISGKCTVKNGTLTIAHSAFSYCANLTDVEFPETIIRIGNGVFYCCDSLTTVNIPKGVTYIGTQAFEKCVSLTNITISSSVKEIFNNAFSGCTSLTDVYYTGYESDWKSITVYNGNDCLLNASIHYVQCIHTPKATITKATPTADGKVVNTCTVCSKVVSTTVIPKASSVKLSVTSYTYDGKAKTPSVTVKDSKGKTLVKNKDYTVSYASGRKYVGQYAVKITFKGNYTGTKTVYFTINPKTTSISSLSAISKGLTAKWKKQTSQTTGYQVQIATNSKFTKSVKSYTVSKNKTVSKKITKLKGKKKYYVRIRTYKTVKINGKSTKIYSSWIKAKAVTTKK